MICTTDVESTRELFIAGCKNGELFYTDRDRGRYAIKTDLNPYRNQW